MSILTAIDQTAVSWSYFCQSRHADRNFRPFAGSTNQIALLVLSGTWHNQRHGSQIWVPFLLKTKMNGQLYEWRTLDCPIDNPTHPMKALYDDEN